MQLLIKQFLTPNPLIVEGSIAFLGDCSRFAKLQSVQIYDPMYNSKGHIVNVQEN